MEQIKNNKLTVTVSKHGAELQSIKDANGKEYLWQADPKFWDRHSPILFPIVCGLWEDKYRVNGKEYKATAISMGNPHLVIFVEDITTVDLPTIGPVLENNSYFKDRINVEFAQIQTNGDIRMRVWERGSGITQACGTGACATAVAAFINKKSGRTSNVVMDGGTLTIEWDEKSNHVFMTGPATKVFDGEIED